MKIEAGKFYKTRDGQKVGPVRRGEGAARYWQADGNLPNGAAAAWYEDGAFWPDGSVHRDAQNAGYDLIAEWTDAPDLTAITTPFGLLDRETQEALKAHGGPWEYWNGGSWTNSASETLHDIDTALTYRAKPAPPKPREWWLSLDQKTQMFFQQSTPSNIDVAGPWIHVREVLPE